MPVDIQYYLPISLQNTLILPRMFPFLSSQVYFILICLVFRKPLQSCSSRKWQFGSWRWWSSSWTWSGLAAVRAVSRRFTPLIFGDFPNFSTQYFMTFEYNRLLINLKLFWRIKALFLSRRLCRENRYKIRREIRPKYSFVFFDEKHVVLYSCKKDCLYLSCVCRSRLAKKKKDKVGAEKVCIPKFTQL